MSLGRPQESASLNAVAELSAVEVKRGLRDAGEMALLDVREPGEFDAGHPFFAASVPFSRFEVELLRLVPNPAARIVLFDEGEGARARRAARAANDLGYRDVAILDGGAAAWRAAGYTLFEGEHVPSKTFGELLLEACRVPTVSAAALDARRRQGEKIVLLDGRPLDEHRKMCVPGSICLPNGDLAYRIGLAVDDDRMPIVVHCAGRTRSILGAQTLRNLGLRNPIVALEDGTQGWSLAGLSLEHGSDRRVDAAPDGPARRGQQEQARRLANRWAVPTVGAAELLRMVRDPSRTTYPLDVRSPEEYAARPAAAIQNAPGGQLVQATDRWLAVRGARVALVDDNEIRAVVTASWLRQMGWDAAVLAGGSEAWPAIAELAPPRKHAVDPVPEISAAEVAVLRERSPEVPIFDLRPSPTFRRAHIEGSRWATRSGLPQLVAELAPQTSVVVVASDSVIAGLAAADLRALGYEPHRLMGDMRDWIAAGLKLVRSTVERPDEMRIDVPCFMHDRHAGNQDAARGYLAWEKGLTARLDADERAAFRIAVDIRGAP
jgi:rhodanese-related sulfurtransferase